MKDKHVIDIQLEVIDPEEALNPQELLDPIADFVARTRNANVTAKVIGHTHTSFGRPY